MAAGVRPLRRLHRGHGRAGGDGADGRQTLEIVLAAYESAATGREVALPFATDARRPIDLWSP